MDKMVYQVGLTTDGASGVLNIQQHGKPETLQHLILDASGLEDLMSNLSKVRLALPEVVTPSLDPGARLDIQNDPAWLVPDAHSGPPGIVLALRHAGYGWLAFHLPKAGAKALSHALASVAKKQL